MRALHCSRPALAASLVFLTACAGGGDDPRVTPVAFAPVTGADTLTVADVDAIVDATASAIDAPFMAIAVVDRAGNVLRVWNRNPVAQIGDLDNSLAASIARTTAYMSHSQAPLTSRTMQFLNTFHFPPVFDVASYTAPVDPAALAPFRATLGVGNTGQGPLWQIEATNRGALYGPFDAGQELPQLVNPDGSTPNPGFTPLPGGIPLYKPVAITPAADIEDRLVGGVGVYVSSAAAGAGTPDPEAAEFAAIQGARAPSASTPGRDYFFPLALPPEGAVFLGGVLLPFVEATTRPAGYAAGINNGITLLDTGAPGTPDPFGYLVSPRDSASAVPFTAAEVRTLIDATVAVALETHAAIRLPAQSPCQMTIAVTDVDGEILGLFRMTDGTLFSTDVAITKARDSFYFSHPASLDADGPRAGQHPLQGIVPPGTAVTCRTLGFLTQPFFPPGIDGSGNPGPLFAMATENRKPERAFHTGFAPPAPPAVDPLQSGLVLFPGSAPLYRNGVLIGGIGVSGDGVEQDDFVTARGIQRAQALLGFQLEPDTADRADAFSFQGVRLPYYKFPQHPGG